MGPIRGRGNDSSLEALYDDSEALLNGGKREKLVEWGDSDWDGLFQDQVFLVAVLISLIDEIVGKYGA
jgi:hypothetical protein